MIGVPGYWYAACASRQLRAVPRAARLLNLDLVLFRASDGGARALLDRCCHRGVKLSRGRCIEGAVSCGYHGWRFDGSGRCVEIPSLGPEQRIPAKAQVPAFACEQRR